MAPVTLPPSFCNSFWSPDYRTGLDVLFRQLEKGCIENQDIASFIESQARSHFNLSAALLEPPLSANNKTTSSLQHTLLSLQAASSARGQAHRALAMELEEHVIMPFNGWRSRHEDRIEAAKDDLLGRNGTVAAWEKEVHRLMGLRQNYIVKTRSADDSEDDAKFAPTSAAQAIADSYTHSPPPPKATGLRRAGTVADRISEKLRAASVHQRSPSLDSNKGGQPPRITTPGKPAPVLVKSPDSEVPETPSSPKEDAFIPPTDEGDEPVMSGDVPPVPSKEGNGTEKQPEEVPVLLSGMSLPVREFKAILHRLDQYLQTHAALGSALQGELSTKTVLASRQRNTILGTYEKTFSGVEIVEWLRKNVKGLHNEWDRCVDAAGELQRMGHLSRIGVGRGFEPTDDTFYVLKVNPSEGTALASIQTQLKEMSKEINISSPTTNYASLIKNYLPTALNGVGSDEPTYVRLRRDADKANEAYQLGIDEAEVRRLEMEEKMERGLRIWEKWERERLGVVNSVLKHYEQILAKLPKALASLQESTQLSVEAFNPEADLKALIEGSRTGPFRPRPHIYEPIEAAVPPVNFGFDLRRWAGEGAWKQMVHAPQRAKDAIPDILTAMLQACTDMSADLEPIERRKSWIYEVPLQEVHLLRNSLNSAQLTLDDMVTISKKFNVPIVASAVKLWLLELNPPVLGWEGWEDAKAVYPSVGADQEREMSSAVTEVLLPLSGVQLFTLNTIIKYWKDLIANTKTEGDDDVVYVTKLSLSAGRSLLRPQYETELTIQDRTPGLFLVDMIEHYESVFPPLLHQKRNQVERIMPTRKRTALVDQRISRSRLSQSDASPAALLAQQNARANAASSRPLEPVAASPPPAAAIPMPAAVPAPARAAAPAAPASAPTPPPQKVASPAPASGKKGGDSDDDEPPFEPPFDAPPENFVSPPGSPISSPTKSSALPPAGAALTRTMSPAAQSTGRASPGSPISRSSATGDDATAPGLRRNVSTDASRLRGPKGARGPRPAPGAGGHGSRGSVSAMAAQFESK